MGNADNNEVCGQVLDVKPKTVSKEEWEKNSGDHADSELRGTGNAGILVVSSSL